MNRLGIPFHPCGTASISIFGVKIKSEVHPGKIDIFKKTKKVRSNNKGLQEIGGEAQEDEKHKLNNCDRTAG